MVKTMSKLRSTLLTTSIGLVILSGSAAWHLADDWFGWILAIVVCINTILASITMLTLMTFCVSTEPGFKFFDRRAGCGGNTEHTKAPYKIEPPKQGM